MNINIVNFKRLYSQMTSTPRNFEMFLDDEIAGNVIFATVSLRLFLVCVVDCFKMQCYINSALRRLLFVCLLLW